MALPSSRVTPVKTCPALRPRWCPKRITLSRPGLLPSTRCKVSAFHPLARAIILADHDYTYCLQLGGLKPPPLGGSFSRFFVSLEA
jgi:hypothetical protein